MNHVKKIVVYWDKPDGFLTQVYEHDTEELYPFAMGKLIPLISANAKLVVD